MAVPLEQESTLPGRSSSEEAGDRLVRLVQYPELAIDRQAALTEYDP